MDRSSPGSGANHCSLIVISFTMPRMICSPTNSSLYASICTIEMTPLRFPAFFGEATGSSGRWRLVFWSCLGLLCSALAVGAPLELTGEQGDGYRPEFQYVVDATGGQS